MRISQKQQELNEAFSSGRFNEYMLAGGAGSAKTIGILNLIDAICEAHAGARIGVFRFSDRNIKENTIPSYKKLLGFKGKDVPIVDKTAKYSNGSEILFRWADISKDPDCDNIKGGEYTGVFFNEVNQIDQKYVNIGKSRVGRWNRFKYADGGDYRIKPFVFMDCNPTDNWVKKEYYDKYVDDRLPEEVFFQLSLPQDNPFLEPEYWEMLNSLPEAEYNRFVLGKWDYSEDPNQLIKYEWIKQSIWEPEGESIAMGIDVAREGNDRTVFAYGNDQGLIDYETFRHQLTTETAQIAMERMKDRGIGSSKVGVDVVGVGGGVVDIMRGNGYHVNDYNSGSSPTKAFGYLQFKNKRAQTYWELREAFQNQDWMIPDDNDLIQELLSLKYKTTDKVIQIASKAELKKDLGSSPDIADAVAILKDSLRGKSVLPIGII